MPGAGIFLPLAKAVRHDSPTASNGSFPLTPTTAISNGLKVGNQNSSDFTSPTPSLPKFSQSVGPARAPSPQGKKPGGGRTSLPRPDSPVRRLQMTPGPRPSIAATTTSKVPSRYGSPTTTRFAQSVRGTAGDPSKKGLVKQASRPNLAPRSASAMGRTTTTTTTTTSNNNMTDDEPMPVGAERTQTNGSIGSVSSFGSMPMRPASRVASRAGNRHNNSGDDEINRLRVQLGERDRQLKEQAATLAEMETSLTEVQSLMESNPDALGGGGGGGAGRRGSNEDRDAPQLRALLREKNEKIAS